MAKTDSTGQYALVSDGAAPAAPVLADGVTVFTPGLSSRKNGYSEFRHGDLLGSLRFLTDANQNVVGDRLFSAFGATAAWDGDPSTPFGWVGDGQSQTDADTGLVLMGHRVYDSRLGRFLSQDPAGDGDNWYAYCGNDPVNGADPQGLEEQTVNGGSGSIESPGYLAAASWSMFDGLDASLAETGMNTDIKNLLQRHISPGAADAFAFMIFRGLLTYDMIGQTVGNGTNGSSGDTHHIVPGTNYSASTDLRIGKLNNKQAEKLVNELAFFGFAAFLRIPGEDHWPDSQSRHIHAVYAGAELGSSTLHQVLDFFHTPELNGLASHAPYTLFHWNPGNVQAIYQYTH